MFRRFFGDKQYRNRQIKNAVLVIIGTAILAFGTGVFLVPFDLITGGMTGLAISLDHFLKLEFISIDGYVTVLTWVLFFLGLFILGRDFALKTLISAIVYPISLSLFMRLADPAVAGGFFNLGGSEHQQIALLLAAIVGGVFVGAGCAFTFLGGGSTGGTDIIAFIICKFFKRLKSSIMIFIVDAAVIVIGIFAIGDLVVCLVGILSAFVASMVIDKIFLGSSKAFIANIVSDEYEKINRAIIDRLDRTSTIIPARGGFSGNEKMMVMVSFSMREYAELSSIIASIDREAFVTVHRAHEINGEGWTKHDLENQENQNKNTENK